MRQLAQPRRPAIDDAARRGCIGTARRTVAGRVAGHGDAVANTDANAVEVAGIISLVDVQERRQRRPGRGRVPRRASRLSDVMLVLERDAQDAPVFPARFEPALDDAHAGVILRQDIATLGKFSNQRSYRQLSAVQGATVTSHRLSSSVRDDTI